MHGDEGIDMRPSISEASTSKASARSKIRQSSLFWLLRHELRLWWRELRAKWFLLIVAIALGLLMLLIVGLWITIIRLGEQPPLQIPIPLPLSMLQIAGSVWIFLFAYSFIQAMQQSLTALFDRGDLDLLISSPIAPKTIFASRLLSVAIEVFLGLLMLIIPMTLIILLIGTFRLLGIYPALIGICLTTASLSMLLTLWLVRWVGARRARTAAQILTMSLAGVFFVGVQLLNLRINTGSSPGGMNVPDGAESLFQLRADSWLWFPVKTFFLDGPSVLLTLAISGGLAWLTVETLNRQFMSGTQQSLTVKRRSPPSLRSTPFTQNLSRVFLFKEWRVIRRSPYLISRTLISAVFLIPLMVLVVRGDPSQDSLDLSAIATIALPAAGAFLTSSLAVICIAGEEAPDLLKSAPVQGTKIRQLKLAAVLYPVWAILALFFGLLILRGVNGLPGLGLALLATTCTALVRLWNARPISLAGMMMRQRENAFSDTILGILESVLFFLWIALGSQVREGNAIAIVAILFTVAIIMAIAYWRSRVLGSSLVF